MDHGIRNDFQVILDMQARFSATSCSPFCTCLQYMTMTRAWHVGASLPLGPRLSPAVANRDSLCCPHFLTWKDAIIPRGGALALPEAVSLHNSCQDDSSTLLAEEKRRACIGRLTSHTSSSQSIGSFPAFLISRPASIDHTHTRFLACPSQRSKVQGTFCSLLSSVGSKPPSLLLVHLVSSSRTTPFCNPPSLSRSLAVTFLFLGSAPTRVT